MKFSHLLICLCLFGSWAGCASPPIKPSLTQPLRFAQFTRTNISPTEARQLMDRKIYLGGNSDDAYEFLTRGQLTVRTETVNQYRRALKQGYTAENTFQLTMVGFFTNTGAVLDFMVVAETSKRSLLNTNLALDLPVTVLNYNGTEQHKALETDAAKGMTVGDYAGKKRITDIKTTSTGTTFSDQSCQYEVRELARGDLDHDGVEDALVSVSTRFKGGSGSGAELMVVTRTDGAKRLRLIGKPGK